MDDSLTKSQRDQLVIDNRRLVCWTIRRMGLNKGTLYRHWDDLESAGLLALVRASRQYDPARGVKFASYAYHGVWREVKAYIRHLGPVSLPHPLARGERDSVELANQYLPVDDTSPALVEAREETERLLATTPEPARQILRRLLAGESQAEIARSTGMHKSRVSQLVVAVKRLQQRIAS